ncbi:MAG: helix-turn-helix transcriptional regulator [Desulfobacterales bacterium]|jgi:poly-beta-hydroxybutyrate-responsive repressor
MSTKRNKARKKWSRPGSGKAERYIQPSILLGLKAKPSYGYELIHNIQKFGFVQGQAPPGMVYRHLRELEADDLVWSEWQTEGTGPARRIYRLTTEGEEALNLWINYMENQANNLMNFINEHKKLQKIDQAGG